VSTFGTACVVDEKDTGAEAPNGTGVDSLDSVVVVVDIMLSDSEKDSGDADREFGSGCAIACSVRVGFCSVTASAVSVSTVMTVSTLASVLTESVEG